ncbi:MAG: hypothetical protein E7317_02780 [Clostridiales bacterium]|nr:hypothetical protein [Clostridiales bacterium]
MGTGYKGGSQIYRSIGQNILPTSAKFHYLNGRFGVNSPHGDLSTRQIVSKDNLATAREFYDTIAYGGIEQQHGSNMWITHMADGSIITMRLVSHSDGTPVVDINIRDSTHTGGVKNQKIHFVQRSDE